MKRLAPLAVDALLVILFCAIGRRSHDEAVLAGMLRTLWPFATGLAIGWAVVLVNRFPRTALWPSGILIWFSTLVGGMVLRVLSGQTIALSFVGVAAAVLALFLLGWRGAVKALER
ncbi:DUF3054 domain-containing protein [Nocardia panacis]|uniref:DUF3054 domain-containing protein n=1 Tax=Nocardia panacis TaxID=2340916 RepID=A0A3A4KDP1_9NOCA|nr:DUF3054 domain-containing protein [Nocardia panacis]RJO76831.1 DUF3054 domain-containing protein [Nocardia panacis]